MLLRHAGNTHQIRPCSSAGRPQIQVKIDRARSPQAQEGERSPEEDHSREGA